MSLFIATKLNVTVTTATVTQGVIRLAKLDPLFNVLSTKALIIIYYFNCLKSDSYFLKISINSFILSVGEKKNRFIDKFRLH